MILRDWRQADPTLLRSCYDAERHSWRQDLGWDTTWTWATVEQARVTRGLPGLLAFDDDRELRGWAFYLRDGGTLHIGGLVSSSPDITRQLLDAILKTAPDAAACFIRDRAPELSDALRIRGFDAERFLYLSRPVRPGERPQGTPELHGPDVTDSWCDADLAAAARLLWEGYPRTASRHFAPDGSIEDWTKYVAGVVGQGGCGRLDPDATRVIRDGDELRGLALVTSIAPETAHLAQLVVHPEHRGRGVASALLREVLARAAASGRTAMTLLVSERNRPARQMYGVAGFTERGTFVAGRCARLDSASII